jgi:hypothetical protein
MGYPFKKVIKVESTLLQQVVEKNVRLQEKLTRNSLIGAIGGVFNRVVDLKGRAREYYFEVLLSKYQCPRCGGHLYMTGQSECSCPCGNSFDPTLAFQKSTCCGASLVRKTFHYACSRCNKTVPSRFLFDEKVFDRAYFREIMQDSRRRAKEKREEIRSFLAESKSAALPFMEEPHLDSIPGLIQDLNDFVQKGSCEAGEVFFDTQSSFHMNDYHDHIMSILSWERIPFSNIAPLIEDSHQDRIWRFITLIFMQNDHEVELTQYGNDILVQKVYNEAYN